MELDIWYYVFGLIMDFYFLLFNFIFFHILFPSFSLISHFVSSYSSPKNRATSLHRRTISIIFLSIQPRRLALHPNTNAFFLSGGPKADLLNIALHILILANRSKQILSVFSSADRFQASAFILHYVSPSLSSPSMAMSSVNISLLDLLVHCRLLF